MSRISDTVKNNNSFRFYGPERYHQISYRELSRKRNNGGDEYVDAYSKPRKISPFPIFVASIIAATYTFMIWRCLDPINPVELINKCTTGTEYMMAFLQIFLTFLPLLLTIAFFVILIVKTVKKNVRERNVEYAGASAGNFREMEISNESETVDFNNDSVT